MTQHGLEIVENEEIWGYLNEKKYIKRLRALMGSGVGMEKVCLSFVERGELKRGFGGVADK